MSSAFENIRQQSILDLPVKGEGDNHVTIMKYAPL